MKLSKLLIINLALLLAFYNSLAVAQSVNKLKANQNFCIEEGQNIQPDLIELAKAFESCFQRKFSKNGRLEVAAATEPMPINFNIKRDHFVESQLQTTGLLSYLLYRKGVVVTDAITPDDRLGLFFDNRTQFQSNSVGKSLAAYLLGHAICRGNIAGLEQTVEDWPLLKNTLYEKQRLQDLVNMNVGDSSYFNSEKVLFKTPLSTKGVNHETVRYFAESLQNSKPPFFRSYNYSQMVSSIVINYIAFKLGDDFDLLLDEVYTKKSRIAYPLQMGYVDRLAEKEDGRLSNSMWVTRYDYLRIAISMLEDWKNGTCVGNYLKKLYKNSVRGNDRHGLFRPHHRYAQHYKYGGFFHTDIANIKDTVFGMGGYGGQFIFINFDKETIVVTSAVHDNFDTAKLIVDAMNE